MLGQDSAGSQNSTDPGGTRSVSSGSKVGSSSTKGSKISRFETTGEKRQQPCKYFLSKQDCPFGYKCRYQHSTKPPISTDVTAQPVSSSDGNDSYVRSHPPKTSGQSLQLHKQRHVPMCRYYLNSTCKYGSKCRYRHPKPRSTPHSDSSSNYSSINTEGTRHHREASGQKSSHRSSDKLSLGAFMKVFDKPLEQGHRQKVKKTTTASELREASI